MTEQQCLKALCRIQCGAKKDKKCEDCECFDDKVNIWKCVENTQESLVLRQLIRQHFELVEKIEWLKEEMTEPVFDFVFSTQGIFSSWYQGIQMYSAKNSVLKAKVSEYENPQPYKFEDLKSDIWICDDKFKDCMKIKIVFEPCKLYPNGSFKAYHDLNEKELNFVEFEEGRFFPVIKAMEYQE